MTTKEKILKACLKIASKEGTKGTSMSKIANEVGISKSSLYYYYKTKDEMILDMYNTFRNQKTTKFELPKNQDPLLTIANAFKNYLLLCQNAEMRQIYTIIESEKFTSAIARELYLAETHKMIMLSKALFKQLFPALKEDELDEKAQIYAFYAHELIILVILNDQEYSLSYALTLITSFVQKCILENA